MSEHNEGGESGGREAIPYSRFSEVVSERNTLREQIAELQANLTDTSKAHESAIEKATREATEAREALEALRTDAAWKDNAIHLAREGVHDEDVVDFIRYQYGRTEGDERPEFGEWLSGFRESKPHLFPSGESKPAKPPSTNKGAKTPPPKSAYSEEEIRRITSTGTREEYRRMKEALSGRSKD